MIFLNLKEKCGISHFFKDEWLNRPVKIQISAFLFRIDSSNSYWDESPFIEGVRSGFAPYVDIVDFRFLFFNGSINGAGGSQQIITFPSIEIDKKSKDINTDKGFWGLIMKEVEFEKSYQTENIESLFRIVFNNYIIQKHEFTNLYEFSNSEKNGKYRAASSLNVYSYDIKKSNVFTFGKFEKICRDISNIADYGLKSRVIISLGWFNKTLNAKSYEKFIYFWVSIEALSMPNTTNVKPLKETLSKIYERQFVDNLCIGRLQGLRSDIFHQGNIPSLSQEFLGFCESLYIDVLYQIIGYDSERVAENYLNNWPDFNLPQFLNGLGTKRKS